MCTSFLTQLDAASADVLLLELLKVSGFRDASKMVGKEVRRPGGRSTSEQFVSVEGFWLKAGPQPPVDLTVEDETRRVGFVLVPSVKRNMRNLARAVVSRRYPVLLQVPVCCVCGVCTRAAICSRLGFPGLRTPQGPTSSGKTSMVEYVAALTGNRCVRINNHEHTDLAEYMGTYVSSPSGKLVFQEGALVEAVRNGYWIILDELNLAPSEVLEALNRLLDDNR